MKSSNSIIIYTTFLLLAVCLSGRVFSQDKKKKYTTQTLAKPSGDATEKKSEFQLTFKNLNVIPYYYNKDELNQIRKYEHKKDYAKLLPALETYVSNFGIQNFSKNTNLLWKLGQLYEVLDQPEKAKFMYKLVLKNHRSKEIKNIYQHYDTLTSNEKDKYVPLKYYYELVEYRKAIDTLRPPQSVFLNMGELVNDNKFPDYGPTLNVNNDILLFTKRKKELTSTKLSFRENEDLYYTKNYDGFWDEALPFEPIINSHCNEGSATLSRDGKTMYFARCKVTDYQYDCRDCMGSCDIYVTTLKDDSTWTVPKNLGPNVNSTAWDSQPTLSHNEDTLYFASDRLGGFGLSDIYFTYKNSKGEWMPAQNMGPIINTRGNEVSPFYHPVHHVFYFSSNGQLLNFGEMDEMDYIFKTFDIYKTRKIQGFWQEPQNIGPLVNGKGDEYYFTIDSKSKDLFYAKSEEGNLNNLDLYSFPLPMEAQPLATTKIKGKLTDSISGETFQGIVSVIDLSNGIEVAPKFMRPDGTYEFDLIDDNDYLLVIQGDEFFRVERKFHLSGDTVMDLQTNSIKYNKWKFSTLEFDNGSAEIKKGMENDLDKVVNFLVDHPHLKLKISGHTDSDGNADANLKLSQRRAEAIKAYIINKGLLDPMRIEAIGYGNQRPIVEEKTEADKRINRRVEFEIIRPELQKDTNDDESNEEEIEENENESW
ncbi:MAG TPA: OmpA family protein [Cytophagaceae bacterium]